MKTIYVTENGFSNLDLGSFSQTTEFVKQDGSYDIKDTDTAIARYVLDYINNNDKTEISEGDYLTGNFIKLERAPRFDEILNAVKNHTPFKITSKPEHGQSGDYYALSHELTWDGLGCEFVLHSSYDYDAYGTKTAITIQDIPKENVGYIVVENFVGPYHRCASIQRFYHEPYRDEQEALKALEEMELHDAIFDEEGNVILPLSSHKEMLVVDVKAIECSDWYRRNLASIGEPWSLNPVDIEVANEKLGFSNETKESDIEL